VPGFGDTNTVEFLDTPPASPVFNAFVNYFVARGYERGNTIRAAPYDWRLAAGSARVCQQNITYRPLKSLNYQRLDKNTLGLQMCTEYGIHYALTKNAVDKFGLF